MTVTYTRQALVLATSICIGLGCGREQSDDSHWYFCPTPAVQAAHWSYEGESGPVNWGHLDPTYELADTGREQSPIEIPSTGWEDENATGNLKFDYCPEAATFVNNGHTIQHGGGAMNSFFWGEKRYTLKQFHFHTPSEHTIDGESFDLEIHLVHKNDADEIAVVAVLARADPGGLPIILTKDGFPGIDEEKDMGGKINPLQFVPVDHRAFHYRGSFTTPPCTEGVDWFVMQQPIVVNSENIKAIQRVVGNNHRPVQPLNKRKIGHLDG